MFDVGFWEFAVIGAIMLIVLGPERLPGVARTAGFWLSKARRMINDTKAEIKREMDAAELSELDDVKKQIRKAEQSVTSSGKVLKEKLINTATKFDDPDSEADADPDNYNSIDKKDEHNSV